MRHIRHCLNPRLVAMCQHSLGLDKLQQIFVNFLDPALRAHCQIGSFREGRLILCVTDPVFATPLRYLLPELRDRLRKEANLHQLRSIEIQIQAQLQKTTITSPKRPLLHLSSQARKALQQASDMCAHPPLKEALQKLAKNQT